MFMLAAALFWLGGCTSAGQMTDQPLPERRPADFTLGVVVFGDADAGDVSSLSARYIVDAAGNLRASVGAGSDAGTYPKITRRLSSEQLDEIWKLVDGLELGEPIADEAMPEAGYLIEIRSGQMSRAWVVEDGSAGAVVGLLAELAWVHNLKSNNNSLEIELIESLEVNWKISENEVAQRVIRQGGVDLNVTHNGYTILHRLVLHRDVSLTDYSIWLLLGANPFALISSGPLAGHSPLSLAVWAGNTKAANMFLTRHDQYGQAGKNEIERSGRLAEAIGLQGVHWDRVDKLSHDQLLQQGWHSVPSESP